MSDWPVKGYAPGNYSNSCMSCDKEFVGDKRALQCLPCAALSANEHITTLESTIRKARWHIEGIFGPSHPLVIEFDKALSEVPGKEATEEQSDGYF